MRTAHSGDAETVPPAINELISASLGFIVTANRTHPRKVPAESVAVRIRSVS